MARDDSIPDLPTRSLAPVSCLAAALLAAGIACGHRPAPAAPPPPTSTTASATPAAAGAAAKRICSCFDWVHLEQFGYECFETGDECDDAHARSGFRDRTICRTTDRYEQCMKVGCARGHCFRYED